MCPGEPPAVCVPDASPAQHKSPAADTTAGPGEDGLEERPQGSLSAPSGPPALHCLPGPLAEETSYLKASGFIFFQTTGTLYYL